MSRQRIAPHPRQRVAKPRPPRTAKRGNTRRLPAGTDAHTVSSPRMMARGIFFCGLRNFFAQVAEIVEAVVSPHGGNEGGQQGADGSQTQRRERRAQRDSDFLRRTALRRRQSRRIADIFRERQKNLNRSAKLHAEIIDGVRRSHHKRCQRLSRGEGEIVFDKMSSEQRCGHGREQKAQKSHESRRRWWPLPRADRETNSSSQREIPTVDRGRGSGTRRDRRHLGNAAPNSA